MKNPNKSRILHLADKMRIQTVPITSRAGRKRGYLTSSLRFGVILVLITAAAFYTVTSASSSKSQNSVKAGAERINQRAELSSTRLWYDTRFIASGNFFAALMPQEAPPPPPPEAIATFETTGGMAPACTNIPKTNFAIGEAVCVKVANAPLRAGAPLRRVNLTGTRGIVRNSQDVTTDPQEFIFTLPGQSSVVDGSVIDNRGIWSVSLNTTSRGSTRAIAYFNVSDPDNAAADLVVYEFSTSAEAVPPGSSTGFFIWLSNTGPDAAQNVHLIVPTSSLMTYTSTTQHTGPAFTCTESAEFVDCEIASLASGAKATLTLNYTISGGAPNGVISSTANIDSDTTDPRPASNVSHASVEVRAAGAPPATCSVGCPGNRVVTANTTQDGQDGAIVNFAAADVEASGECGTITFTPPSGFFAIGTHTIDVSAGGSSCSFTVTVIDPADSPAPTIDCEDDINATAPAGQLETSVTITPPTGTGENITITGVRNDNRALDDPYPVGTTTITWTARECLDTPMCESPDARTASCLQRVIVTTEGAPTIDCPDDKTFTASGCEITLTAEQIGTPEATGSGVEVTSRRSDDRPLLDPYPAGPTTITWTATDDIGRIVSCAQVITVIAGGDTTPPTLNVPPDVTVNTDSCSALLDDELGVATADDNCAGVTISRTGVPSVACPIPGDPGRTCETFVFPTGETIITYTARDATGLETTGTQKVTVLESVFPTIDAPPNVTANTDNGSCSATGVALGTPTAADNCAVKSVTNDAPASFPLGPTTVTWTVEDKSGNKTTDTQVVTVVDNQNPTITAPADVAADTDLNSCSATGVNLGTPTTADNCTVASVTNDAPSVFPLGSTTVTWTVTDGSGRTATDTQIVTVSDNQDPTITVPANVTVQLPLNSSATSRVVTYNPATATDNCSGAITIGYSHASGSVFPVGTTTVTVTATDAHNNTATATFTVTVLYNFTGFFSPVGNLPVLNSVNAGRAIPVKFSLSGNKGLNIFAPNNPYTVAINCSTTDPAADITETLTAGGSSLTYSPDQYHYVWKTESSWAGTCRQLVITLNDGSVHKANFKFK